MPDTLLIPRRLLTISSEETKFARRGFQPSQPAAQHRLEQSGGAFLDGYHAGLCETNPIRLAARLEATGLELRGFAYEGAAMSLMLQDRLALFRRGVRFHAFLAGPGDAHAYMLHVGAGWAFARLPWLRARFQAALATLDPLLGWLAADGYGFHEGYFHWRAAIERQRIPGSLQGYARRAFDQGLGRALWFYCGADAARIPPAIARFNAPRRDDLWSGAGLACAYAGGLAQPDLERLFEAAGPYRPAFAQGVAFAAEARRRAGNIALHTELACRVACDLGALEAAELTQTARRALPQNGAEPAYETWRRRVQREVAAMAKMAG